MNHQWELAGPDADREIGREGWERKDWPGYELEQCQKCLSYCFNDKVKRIFVFKQDQFQQGWSQEDAHQLSCEELMVKEVQES